MSITVVQKEKAAGTPDKDIAVILAQHTGWKKEQVTIAFPELHP